jgi:hypothetical protein
MPLSFPHVDHCNPPIARYSTIIFFFQHNGLGVAYGWVIGYSLVFVGVSSASVAVSPNNLIPQVPIQELNSQI